MTLFSRLSQALGSAVSPAGCVVPCVRFNCIVRLYIRASSTVATLGMSGWLDLAQRGLSPHKKRQASLGALTLQPQPPQPHRVCSRSLRAARGPRSGWRRWLGFLLGFNNGNLLGSSLGDGHVDMDEVLAVVRGILAHQRFVRTVIALDNLLAFFRRPLWCQRGQKRALTPRPERRNVFTSKARRVPM